MCQTIGTCYVESKENILVKLREEISCFLFRNRNSTPKDINEFVTNACLKSPCEINDLLEYFRKDLEIGKKIASAANKPNAIREIQKMYCNDYEKVLSAVKQAKGDV